MAELKRLTVYPDPQAWRIVGGSSPACNRAIECFAQIVRDAHTREPLASLGREEWNFLADVLNGTILESNWGPTSLLAEAEDAMRLDGTDWKWFGEEDEGLGASLARSQKRSHPIHPRGAVLLERIGAFDYAQTQAVLCAVAWFWDHHESVDASEDAWWTPEYRARFRD